MTERSWTRAGGVRYRAHNGRMTRRRISQKRDREFRRNAPTCAGHSHQGLYYNLFPTGVGVQVALHRTANLDTVYGEFGTCFQLSGVG